MKKSIKRSLVISGILFTLFLVWLFLVLKVDVRAIGPIDSVVGLATLNEYVWNFIGVTMVWYHITDILGLVGIFIVFIFALLGLFQLIKRKSVFKVDLDILVLGFYYLMIVILYILFEVCIVNYRPVLIDNCLEASFPSSHTLMMCFVVGSAMIQYKRRIKNKLVLKLVNCGSMIVLSVTVIGRLLSGVHWFSDIVGGLLLGGVMVYSYYACVLFVWENKINL